ncbi:Fe-S cluster assembly protein SufD [Foetidibacter luteolus]|uniref:Fe-S cluster assembly protein SufD n=1 Tax=Foetidibacter luteolus TaxID=2608880 RepID=UPI00129B171A|nr:Fe-S cluster assembly protein SufD [Foetidibacter luteolus]
MNNIAYYKEEFDKLQLQESPLAAARQEAFKTFNLLGIPTAKHEEWKYTRIGSVLNKSFQLAGETSVTADDVQSVRLPGSETANELIFVNGIYSAELSTVRSKWLEVAGLEEAAKGEHKEIVATYFNHSRDYLKDGINALNTAFIQGGIFVQVAAKKVVEHPVYIYNITDARKDAVLSQPRSLIHVGRQAEVSIVETYITLGSSDSMTNQVMEIAVEEDANLAYYKIQNDAAQASQVSTTHIRQTGKSVVNTVTVSLNGGIVRNNLHAVMEAEHAEAHLWGLYFQHGQSHIDNHTIVDNAVPNCQSNELYKGILDGQSSGVFNGKIFVRKDAQKTNAFQSNKNVLLSDSAGINTKPQLEIFADDVKCSHGCTVGSLDDEALFYLQSRGIPHKPAMALLLQGFAVDILEKIKLAPIRSYVEEQISQRLAEEVL